LASLKFTRLPFKHSIQSRSQVHEINSAIQTTAALIKMTHATLLSADMASSRDAHTARVSKI
jgi:hypothetical protein